MADSPTELAALAPRLRFRHAAIAAIRGYFAAADFVEVATPARIAAPAPEEYIEAPQAGALFLRPSPELEMKRLLAAGLERIYQIGPCFRAGEWGRLHAGEFSMLEWYQTGVDYRQLMEFTANMLAFLAGRLFGGKTRGIRGRQVDFGRHQVITVANAFRQFAGMDVDAAIADGRFEELLVERVESRLGLECPTFLTDYPPSMASLAQVREVRGHPVAERWELYLTGVELANAYGELTDAAEQKRRFAAAAAMRREADMTNYPEPVEFLAALEHGLPQSSGCALGIDRLVMLLADANSIAEVMFPVPRET